MASGCTEVEGGTGRGWKYPGNDRKGPWVPVPLGFVTDRHQDEKAEMKEEEGPRPAEGLARGAGTRRPVHGVPGRPDALISKRREVRIYQRNTGTAHSGNRRFGELTLNSFVLSLNF